MKLRSQFRTMFYCLSNKNNFEIKLLSSRTNKLLNIYLHQTQYQTVNLQLIPILPAQMSYVPKIT